MWEEQALDDVRGSNGKEGNTEELREEKRPNRRLEAEQQIPND